MRIASKVTYLGSVGLLGVKNSHSSPPGFSEFLFFSFSIPRTLMFYAYLNSYMESARHFPPAILKPLLLIGFYCLKSQSRTLTPTIKLTRRGAGIRVSDAMLSWPLHLSGGLCSSHVPDFTLTRLKGASYNC